MVEGGRGGDWRGEQGGGWRGTRRQRRSCLFRRRGRDRSAGHVSTFFIIPSLLVVDLLFRVEPGVETVFGKLESVLDNERGVGEVEEIVLGDSVVRDSVVDHASEEGDVGTGAD